MFRKFLFFTLFLSCMGTMLAQHVSGSWKVIPMTGSNFDIVQDTPSKVYYLTGGSLYSYDGEETVYYTPGTKISDSGISTIKYNGDKKYLAIVYSNTNIDLIYDNGKVVNLPEIKDANFTFSKSINNIQFGKDRIYVATNFGIVVYDDTDHHVVESAIYNQSIPYLFEVGDYMIIVTDKDIMYSKRNDRHNSLNKFTTFGTPPSKNYMFTVSNNSYISLVGTAVTLLTIDVNDNRILFNKVQDVPGAKSIQPYSQGYYVIGNDGVYLFNANGTFNTKQSINSSLKGQNISFWKNPSIAWVANEQGIGQFNLADGSSIYSKYFPESSHQYKPAFATHYPDGSKVYYNGADNTGKFPDLGYWDNHWGSFKMESYDWNTGEIQQYIPEGIIGYGSWSKIVFDKEDPSYIYVVGNTWGITAIKDNKLLYYLNAYNSPISEVWFTGLFDLQYDRKGNLWVAFRRESGSVPGSNTCPYKFIPAEYVKYLRTDPDKLSETTTDAAGNVTGYKYWQQPEPLPGYNGFFDATLIFSSNYDKGLYYNGNGDSGLIGIDTKNSSDASKMKFEVYRSFEDQDHNILTPYDFQLFKEDKDGKIWVGTDNGIFYIEDIEQIADGSSKYLKVVRPKVARNDGTNYADYLLASDKIINIDIDALNRKWISTYSSGLFCVSPDGTEILAEFNKDNSPLLSNYVSMVACNPNGNDVLIGTPAGLFVYGADSAPAKDDYSEVYAFPNPVRPDYTGWISINGLMDNSLVKITDSMSNLVWQGRSEGGMAVWDGCDANGNRVRSGVYMVFASQNENGNSGAVTKIVVIN